MSTILFRRDHLAMTKNFWCSCSRCCDSTEFGSNISTIFDRWLLLSLSFKKYPLSSNQASPFQPLSCVTDNIQSIAGNQCCQKIHWTHRLTGFARRQVRWKKLFNFEILHISDIISDSICCHQMLLMISKQECEGTQWRWRLSCPRLGRNWR